MSASLFLHPWTCFTDTLEKADVDPSNGLLLRILAGGRRASAALRSLLIRPFDAAPKVSLVSSILRMCSYLSFASWVEERANFSIFSGRRRKNLDLAVRSAQTVPIV